MALLCVWYNKIVRKSWKYKRRVVTNLGVHVLNEEMTP